MEGMIMSAQPDNNIDHLSMVMRRLVIMEERQEQLYLSLYLAIMSIGVGILLALYVFHRDLTKPRLA
jgi:uncharacterized membrane protein